MAYQMALLPATFGDLEGNFCCLKPPPRWFASMIVRWWSNTRWRQHWW